jgi:hypothetical protein
MTAIRLEYVAILVGVLLLFGARYGRSGRVMLSVEGALNGRAAPWLVGLCTAVLVGWVWGSLRAAPLISDEASYLLQAKLFASGRWSAPSPPLPEFFEQEHVLVVPRLASKYPPGHALVLAPGALMSLPGLIPLLLSGLTGALVFVLARRISHAWVAVLTWLLWLSASGNLIYRASYFSEVTTGALWAGGWWAALQFRDTGRQRWLILLAALVGCGAITRPLTMLAFAIPIGIAVLWVLSQSGRLRLAVWPLLVTLVPLAIIPLWNSRVTGDWKRTPLGVYTEQYMPWDVPGFGLVTTPGTREPPPDARGKFAGFMARHQDHQVAHLPRITWERVAALGDALFGGWRLWLLPVGLAGLAALTAIGWLVVLCGASLFLAYLLYAHPPAWVVYYLEAFPIPAFVVALGLWTIATRLAEALPTYKGAAALPAARARAALLLLGLLFAPLNMLDAAAAQGWWQRRAHHRAVFDSALASIGDRRAVVFVRHDSNHSFFTGHVENNGDLERAPVWLVHDRGDENERLRRVAPNRRPYRYDEPGRSLEPLAAGEGER